MYIKKNNIQAPYSSCCVNPTLDSQIFSVDFLQLV